MQNYFGVRCDPSLPYDPNFTPPDKPGKDVVACSRQNFIELCERLTALDEQAFEEVCRRLGLSIDWTLTYQTIDQTARAISQRAFLHNLVGLFGQTVLSPLFNVRVPVVGNSAWTPGRSSVATVV